MNKFYIDILTFRGDHKQKFYWGHKEILVPVYKNMSDAMKKHTKADVLVSFASLRSAYESTLEAMEYPQVKKKKLSISKSLESKRLLSVAHVLLTCDKCSALVLFNLSLRFARLPLSLKVSQRISPEN